ncbi:MAG: DUF502 domain-containing protein [Nitrospira sp.]|nr:MAG: DUF502 domain-containing protein [Nitrospira sp.]
MHIFAHGKHAFLTGLLIIIPAWGTFLILDKLVSTLDHLVGQLLGPFIREDAPGLGLITGLLLLLLAGVLTTRLAGQRLFEWTERSLERIPVVGGIYRTMKGVGDLANFRSRFGRSTVVAFPFPRDGLWALGFVLGPAPRPVQTVTPVPLAMLFVPTAIHPFTGYLAFVPQHSLRPVNLPPEEAMKIEFSAGLYNQVRTGSPGRPSRPTAGQADEEARPQ